MPYDYKQGSDGKWYVMHKGTGKKAVARGYRSKKQAERVGGLRMYFEHKGA
jgi:hypothetical protein